eukprot:m.11175 g.11175  ORF g.11175 m.11175 type:complete len:522 (+) comp8692_c0_seq1:174-1739(+)
MDKRDAPRRAQSSTSTSTSIKTAMLQVRHVLGCIIGIAPPEPEIFRLAKFDKWAAAAPMLKLVHHLLMLQKQQLLVFNHEASRHVQTQNSLDTAWDGWENQQNRSRSEANEHKLGIVQFLLRENGYTRQDFYNMTATSISSQEVLIALGWMMAEWRILESWAEHEMKLSFQGNPQTVGCHLDDDTQGHFAVNDDANVAVKMREKDWERFQDLSSLDNPVTEDSFQDILKQLLTEIGRSKLSIRALLAEQRERSKRLHRLRCTTAPTKPPIGPNGLEQNAGNRLSMFEMYLLDHPSELAWYQKRLSKFVDAAEKALFARQKLHPLWWQWLASITTEPVAEIHPTQAAFHSTPVDNVGLQTARDQFGKTYRDKWPSIQKAFELWGSNSSQSLGRSTMSRIEQQIVGGVSSDCRTCCGNNLSSSTTPQMICRCPETSHNDDIYNFGQSSVIQLRLQQSDINARKPPQVQPQVGNGAQEQSASDTKRILEESIKTSSIVLERLKQENTNLMTILLAKVPNLVLVG